MKTLSLVICSVLVISGISVAQEASTPLKEPQNVRLISDLTKQRDDNKIQVKDLVLDLETGHAALQIVSWRHTNGSSEVVAVVPFFPELDIKKVTQLAKELTSPDPAALTRKLAATIHATFGEAVYWSKYISKLPKETSNKFDQEQYQLVPFQAIKNKKIVAINGTSLGTLEDVGLSDAGEIVYCVVKSSDGCRAIPLGAFLDRERDKDWKIELKPEQVFQFKTFDPKQPPHEVDRGWQEYVAVRYGRDTLQEVPKANP